MKYTYDANGNIVQIKEDGIFKARYAYDALNRLVTKNMGRRVFMFKIG
ncbi:MAG: RHS repeat protein [Clostridiales bacterium]|nr:RHS repeat protein [Clostridiales bacterium]